MLFQADCRGRINAILFNLSWGIQGCEEIRAIEKEAFICNNEEKAMTIVSEDLKIESDFIVSVWHDFSHGAFKGVKPEAIRIIR